MNPRAQPDPYRSDDDPRVVKIGLALVRDREVLLVRRRGNPWLILPGGKPLPTETDAQALARECREELSCAIVPGSLCWLGEFSGELVDDRDREVSIRLYSASLEGDPKPSSEIEELWWQPLGDATAESLAPTLREIIPWLSRRTRD